jgi:hypothetical protein
VSWTNDYPAFPDARCAADARCCCEINFSYNIYPSQEVNEKRMVFSSGEASKDKSAMEERKGPSKRDKEML